MVKYLASFTDYTKQLKTFIRFNWTKKKMKNLICNAIVADHKVLIDQNKPSTSFFLIVFFCKHIGGMGDTVENKFYLFWSGFLTLSISVCWMDYQDLRELVVKHWCWLKTNTLMDRLSNNLLKSKTLNLLFIKIFNYLIVQRMMHRFC